MLGNVFDLVLLLRCDLIMSLSNAKTTVTGVQNQIHSKNGFDWKSVEFA